MDIYHSKFNSNLRERDYTLGVNELIDLETRDSKSLPYSEKLHSLIAGCLMIEPSDRITPEALVALTRENHNLWQQAQGSDIERSNIFPELSESKLSDRWYSGQKKAMPHKAQQRNAKCSHKFVPAVPELPPQPQRPNVRSPFPQRSIPQQLPLQPSRQPQTQPEPQQHIPHQRRAPPPLPPNSRPVRYQNHVTRARAGFNHPLPSFTHLAEGLFDLDLAASSTATSVRPHPLYHHQLAWEQARPHLGTNMDDAGTYKTLRFMIRKGEWSSPKAQGEVTFHEWGKGEKVMRCKTELAKGRGIRAAEVMFRCGMRGEVMENERLMGDYAELDRDGIVEVFRIPAG